MLTAALLVSMVLAVGIGAVDVPAGDVWTVLVHHATGRGAVDDIALDQIVWQFRTPRVVLAAVVGRDSPSPAPSSRPSSPTPSPIPRCSASRTGHRWARSS